MQAVYSFTENYVKEKVRDYEKSGGGEISS